MLFGRRQSGATSSSSVFSCSELSPRDVAGLVKLCNSAGNYQDFQSLWATTVSSAEGLLLHKLAEIRATFLVAKLAASMKSSGSSFDEQAYVASQKQKYISAPGSLAEAIPSPRDMANTLAALVAELPEKAKASVTVTPETVGGLHTTPQVQTSGPASAA